MGLTVVYARIGHSEFYFIIMRSGGHAAAHLAWITAHARSGKLDTGREMPAFRIDSIS